MTVGLGSLPSFIVRFPQGIVQTIGVGADAVMSQIVKNGGQAEMVLKSACDSVIQQLIAQKGIVPVAQVVSALRFGVAGAVLTALGCTALYVAASSGNVGSLNRDEREQCTTMQRGAALLAALGLAVSGVALYKLRAISAAVA